MRKYRHVSQYIDDVECATVQAIYIPPPVPLPPAPRIKIGRRH